jgi:hypothetical protein
MRSRMHHGRRMHRHGVPSGRWGSRHAAHRRSCHGRSHGPALRRTKHRGNPTRKQPKNQYLAHGALPGSSGTRPPNTIDASRAAGVTRERLAPRILHYSLAEDKTFLGAVNTSNSCPPLAARWPSCAGRPPAGSAGRECPGFRGWRCRLHPYSSGACQGYIRTPQCEKDS